MHNHLLLFDLNKESMFTL
uniref:Uncharacterized protein n=1 Tax=Rhizophora mucronata TaxID=61149 RepID=A0A2P2N8Q0_RHIMU